MNAAEVYQRSVNASRRAERVGVDEKQAEAALHPSSAASPPLPLLQQRLLSAPELLLGLVSAVRDAVRRRKQQIRSVLIGFASARALVDVEPVWRNPEDVDSVSSCWR